VIRVAVRGGVLFLFAAAVLAAFGTDLLLQSNPALLKRFVTPARRFAVAVTAFVLLAIIGAYVAKLTGFAVDTVERGRLAFIRRAASALSADVTPPNLSILVPLALVFATVFLLWALSERRLTSRRFVIGLVALLLIDLSWNSSQFDHTFDRSRVFPKTEITDLLHTLPPGRVLVVPSDLETNRSVSAGGGAEKIIAPPNTLLPYQISTVTGKNQQFPRWYREFASLIEPQPNLSHVVFDQYRGAYFDLLNVRYVLTHESAAHLTGCDLLATAEGVSLYKNRSVMPRAFFALDIIEVASNAASLDALRDPGFNPRTTAVIETGDHVAIDKPALNTDSPDSAVIVEDKRNRVVAETTNARDGLLVLSDNYYPGWRAYVDGSRAEVLRANHTMRAVKVPAGRHMVSFVFMPKSFFVSVYISIAVAIVILLALIVAALKRRRSISHDLR
jgi:hypothetical protein